MEGLLRKKNCQLQSIRNKKKENPKSWPKIDDSATQMAPAKENCNRQLRGKGLASIRVTAIPAFTYSFRQFKFESAVRLRRWSELARGCIIFDDANFILFESKTL